MFVQAIPMFRFKHFGAFLRHFVRVMTLSNFDILYGQIFSWSIVYNKHISSFNDVSRNIKCRFCDQKDIVFVTFEMIDCITDTCAKFNLLHFLDFKNSNL